MKLTTLLIALLSFAPLSSVVRAETLAEMAAAAGTDWMIGKWATEDGGVSIAYEWKLDKNVVGVTFKMGDREAEGMIMRKPGTDTVIYGAADNKGGLTTGKWMDFNGEATLVTTHTDAEGNEKKMAAAHSQSGSDTMIVKLYAVGADGKPEGSPVHEVTFKRR